jgi:hypothetical protein
MWFRAMWYVTSQKNGASALGLQRVLGLSSYETAWTWLHKLTRAMVQPDRDRLSGWIEVDETLVGGLEEAVFGRQTMKKSWVVIAAQVDGAGIGRIRMRMIPDCSAANLHPFVVDGVEPGSVIHTDGWTGYAGLEKKGYQRQITKIVKSREKPSRLMPRVHRVVAVETLATGYPPRRSGILLPTLLFGRIHLSLQSSKVQEPREALFSARATGRPHAAENL